MRCARLDHFVRFNSDGTIGLCGHMVNASGFGSYQELHDSEWRQRLHDQMAKEQWPDECVRCQQTETTGRHSIRLHSLSRHAVLSRIRPDYLILGGVLDNICNSACQSCHAGLSSKIAGLQKKHTVLDNSGLIDKIPMDRVIEIDLNGGEPTASPAYQSLLEDLPQQVQVLRVNTNGSRMLPNIESLLTRSLTVIVTLSLDGVDKVHDYVRWPIQWTTYQRIVDQYLTLADKHSNLKLQAWTTVHALNLGNFDSIKQFAKQSGLDHDWAYLQQPSALNVRFANTMTTPYRDFAPDFVASDTDNQAELDRFIQTQDTLRGISIKDYL